MNAYPTPAKTVLGVLTETEDMIVSVITVSTVPIANVSRQIDYSMIHYSICKIYVKCCLAR